MPRKPWPKKTSRQKLSEEAFLDSPRSLWAKEKSLPKARQKQITQSSQESQISDVLAVSFFLGKHVVFLVKSSRSQVKPHFFKDQNRLVFPRQHISSQLLSYKCTPFLPSSASFPSLKTTKVVVSPMPLFRNKYLPLSDSFRFFFCGRRFYRGFSRGFLGLFQDFSRVSGNYRNLDTDNT